MNMPKGGRGSRSTLSSTVSSRRPEKGGRRMCSCERCEKLLYDLEVEVEVVRVELPVVAVHRSRHDDPEVGGEGGD